MRPVDTSIHMAVNCHCAAVTDFMFPLFHFNGCPQQPQPVRFRKTDQCREIKNCAVALSDSELTKALSITSVCTPSASDSPKTNTELRDFRSVLISNEIPWDRRRPGSVITLKVIRSLNLTFNNERQCKRRRNVTTTVQHNAQLRPVVHRRGD